MGSVCPLIHFCVCIRHRVLLARTISHQQGGGAQRPQKLPGDAHKLLSLPCQLWTGFLHCSFLSLILNVLSENMFYTFTKSTVQNYDSYNLSRLTTSRYFVKHSTLVHSLILTRAVCGAYDYYSYSKGRKVKHGIVKCSQGHTITKWILN